MRRIVVLLVGLLALTGCGGGDAGAFCATAEELRVAHGELLALVIEEGDPPLDELRDRTAQGAALARRLAETAPDDAVRQDYELIAEYQQESAEHFASMTSPDQAAPVDVDDATMQAFDRTEAYVLEECGIDLWPQL